MAAAERDNGPVNWCVLNAEANVAVDLTALDALDQLRDLLSHKGITFAMVRVKQDSVVPRHRRQVAREADELRLNAGHGRHGSW